MKEGRPVEMGSNRRGFPFSFYMDPQEKEDMEEIRWREKKSMSELIRMAIDEYVKNHKDGNDTYVLDTWQNDPNSKALPSLNTPDEDWTKYLQDNCNDKERIELLHKGNHVVNTIKTINYWNSKKIINK